MFSWVQSSIPLSKQLEYYKECQTKLVEAAGQSSASSIISDAIYLISAGTSDFVQNYYINPLLNKLYTTDQFSDTLLRCYSNFIQACLSQPWNLALKAWILFLFLQFFSFHFSFYKMCLFCFSYLKHFG